MEIHMIDTIIRIAHKAAFASLAMACWLPAYAADHNDPPAVRDDSPFDIADLYAWHQGNKLVAILTHGGPAAPVAGQTGVFNNTATYRVNIDNNADNVVDISIATTFKTDVNGATTVTVTNLPGATGPISGPVETTLDAAAGLQVFAGLRDDPFFFDGQGFSDTLATGTLSFDNTRDTFAGQNVTAIVLEMDLAEATAGSNSLRVWASTER
jgi:hypothetical protein